MHLQKSIQHVFGQLTASLEQLTDEQYVYAGKTLSDASIGQHVRHIIEMFTCLEEGYAGTGMVNYENRKRDQRIETEKDFACALLNRIAAGLDKQNKALVLEAVFDANSDEVISIDSNYFREVAFNLEHTIHHMALIKIGIREIADIAVPDGFGVASSTIKFRSVCAQ